jgi:hypothetical protein
MRREKAILIRNYHELFPDGIEKMVNQAGIWNLPTEEAGGNREMVKQVPICRLQVDLLDEKGKMGLVSRKSIC